MKRIGNIYEKICDIENIKTAILKASLGKRSNHRVLEVLDNIDFYAQEISELLYMEEYIPSPYIKKTILDGASQKERTIYKPRFYPDQIIHWALMNQIQPILMRGMYAYSCGSVPKRGSSYGQKYLQKVLSDDRKNTKYCLKMDVKKFYPSINNEILKQKFRRIIKDGKCLCLIDNIIDSETGLPIGNYTSQWFSNFFLQDLDHFIKEKLRIKYYVRYVDDLVLLGGNKRKLHRAKREIDLFLKHESLEIKKNWQVFKVSIRPIDFLGFRFYGYKTTLRRRNSLRIRRRMRKISKKPFLTHGDACSIIAYWGWLKRSNSRLYYMKYVKPYVNIKIARKAVSYYAKRNSIRSDSRL